MILGASLHLAVATCLFVAAARHLTAPRDLVIALEQHGFRALPARAAAFAVAVVESSLAAALIVSLMLPTSARLTLAAAVAFAVVMALYSSSMVIRLRGGETEQSVPCGCSKGEPLSVWTIVRALSIAAAGFVALLSPSAAAQASTFDLMTVAIAGPSLGLCLWNLPAAMRPDITWQGLETA